MVKSAFLGSNTPKGFVGYFDDMMNYYGTIILKGGPGTGKSTLMKKIAEKAQSEGFDCELYYCSGDPDSLDGVCIPERNFCVLDGTSPHSLDAPAPLINEFVFNLADKANAEALKPFAVTIKEHLAYKKRYYQCAYAYLRAAASLRKYCDDYILSRTDERSLNVAALDIANQINRGTRAARRFFADAITPKGDVSFLDSLVQEKRIFALIAPSDAVAREVISRTEKLLAVRGLNFHSLKSPFFPESGLHLVTDDIAVVAQTNSDADKIYEFRPLTADLSPVEAEARDLTDKAIGCFVKAREHHLAVEEYYVKNMDFADINKKTQRILSIIFG